MVGREIDSLGGKSDKLMYDVPELINILNEEKVKKEFVKPKKPKDLLADLVNPLLKRHRNRREGIENLSLVKSIADMASSRKSQDSSECPIPVPPSTCAHGKSCQRCVKPPILGSVNSTSVGKQNHRYL